MRARLAATGLLATVALAGACGGDRDAAERPGWVELGVEDLRAKLAGRPAPVAVTWGDTPERRWVTVRFAKTHVCTGCSSPRGIPSPRGNGGRVEFAPGTTTRISWSVGPFPAG